MRPIMLSVVLCAIASCLTLSGCDTPKTTSPISKQQVTAEQLQAEVTVWQAERESKAKADAEADAQSVREAQAESKRLAAKATRDAERRLRQMDADAQVVREDLEDAIAKITDDFSFRVDSVHANARSRLEADASSERAMQAKADAAIADINRQIEQRGMLAKLAQGGMQIAASAVPGAAPAISGLEALLGTTGLLGIAGTIVSRIQVGRSRASHRADLARMEKVVDAIDVAKDKDETFAKAFTANKTTLSEWMGSEGKALVSKLQQHAA
jgi:hypothetical protein